MLYESCSPKIKLQGSIRNLLIRPTIQSTIFESIFSYLQNHGILLLKKCTETHKLKKKTQIEVKI